jgi:hypothetical protein
MRSRSLLERLSTLVVTGGLLAATSFGSMHDPSCSHHRAAEEGVPAAAGGHAGHGPAHHASLASRAATEDPASHGPQHGSSTEDCTCPGGLCVLSVAAPLPATRSTEWAPAAASHADSSAEWVAFAPPAPEHVQPPGTGPPLRV